MKTIYLDYAAASPTDPKVLAAMKPYFSERFYNPSATYLAARQLRLELSEARARVAACLGARSAEIIFTSGATEANNLAIQGVLAQYRDAEVLVSALEHSSVLETAKNFKHKIISVSEKGVADLVNLEKLVTDNTVLVSVMLVNNELGTIQPLAEISQILNRLSKLRKSKGNQLPIYLHTDAAQAGNYLDLHVSRLGVDLLSLNGGKIYGPKQSGALWVKAGTNLKPLIFGGGQEFGLRSGTENLASCVGLATALNLAQSGRAAEVARLMPLRDKFINGLTKLHSNVFVSGAKNHLAPHIVSVTFSGVDNERLMMQLDEAGVICGVGSACSASNDEPSHVLKALGLSDKDARSTLRFSFGKQTSDEQLTKVLGLLAKLTTV